MQILLALVGLLLVLVGTVVVLFLPTRPGGRVAWLGLEVASISAGLPLIVLGLIALVLGRW